MSKTFEQMLARDLSFYQWEFLADHFQGPRPIRPNEQRTRIALAHKKLIRVNQHYRPTHTMLTDKGHAVMCAAMGLMADTLITMGYTGVPQPKERYGYGCSVTTTRRPFDGVLPAHAKHQS